MLNSELQLKLKEQKILPILNTTSLSNDIDRLSKYLEKNRAIRYIEITLTDNQSFDIGLELKKHFTVVIVTHSMSQAQRVSDYTGFMYLGRLVEFDKTSKIFGDPSKELTARYISGRFG